MSQETGRRRPALVAFIGAAALLSALAVIPVSTQTPPGGSIVQRNPDVIGPVVPGRFDGDLRSLPVRRAWQPGDPMREVNPRRLEPPEVVPDDAIRQTPPVDPLFNAQATIATVRQDRAFGTPTLNFAGQGFSGAFPPDTVGDVGPNHYIQAINANGGSSVVIYNKAGVTVAGPFVMASLGTGACAVASGDPIVLYDSLADRWLLTEFASPPSNVLCVYVSMTSDPVAGGWHRYSFPTPNFPDYPKYGVWPDAYYVGTNEGVPAVYAMDRVRMLAGAPATMQRFTAPGLAAFGFQNLIPADHDGPTPPPAGAPNPFMRHRDDEAHNPGANNPGNDQLEIFEFHVDFANPANSTFTGPIVPVAEFDSELCGFVSFNCFPQPNGQQLDPLREVIMHRLVHRNFGTHQALIGNYTTDVDGTNRGGIRWFELRRAGGAWALFQEGTHSPDATHRWMGSIAMDGSGNIAAAYSVTSPTVPAGIRYAGRLATDPPGTMAQGEHVIIPGAGSQANVNRWGDYSAMGLDPADDCTFWYTNQYVPASGLWNTQIATFKFDTCGAAGLPGPVTNFMAAVNNFDVNFTWGAAPGATSYRLEAGSAPGLSDFLILPLPNVLSFAATGPAGNYFVGMRGVNAAGAGPRTEINVVLPGGGCTTAPNAPTGLTFTVVGNTVTLNWTASTGCPPTSYIVEAGSAPGLNNLARFDTMGTATTVTVPGVPSGTYFVRVIGRNAFGASGPSNEITIPVP